MNVRTIQIADIKNVTVQISALPWQEKVAANVVIQCSAEEVHTLFVKMQLVYRPLVPEITNVQTM